MIPSGQGKKANLMKIDLARADDELEQLRESLAEVYEEDTDRNEKTRMYQSTAKKGALENFSVGSYVLWSKVDEQLRDNKLVVRWVGPYRVMEALEYSFKIQHLITEDTTEVHGSRLKYCDDASLNVNEVETGVVQHVSKQGIAMGVESIKGHRYNDTTRQWELLISWRGLQDVEDSWEPLRDLLRSIPVLVEEYAQGRWPQTQ